MNKAEIMYKVKNRSASRVVYRDPELGVRREFQPGETKIISVAELEKLSYIPGGRVLMANFLQLEPRAVKKVGLKTEPEYYMSEEQVKDLLLNGSQDAFLDCLDFAPDGVIDLIKHLSITLPLTDINKRRALKNKLGYDVDAAIRHLEEERAETQGASESTATQRRTSSENSDTVPSIRRTRVNYLHTEPDEDENEEDEEEIVHEEKVQKKRGRPPIVRNSDIVSDTE